jgi:RNA polymerase sigma-70 factor (ECF subfamily)
MPDPDNSSVLDLGAIEPNELARRAHGGCADSFAELSRRFRPRLLNLLKVRLGGRHLDAEDVAQEALAKAFRHLDRFNPRYCFSTWLYTIAIRLAHDHIRSQRRRPPQVSLIDAQDIANEPTAAAQLQRQEDIDNIWQTAKRLLPDAQFNALWLRYGEGLSTIDVARTMQRTRIGVRVLLHRARLTLVDELNRRDMEFPSQSRRSMEKS